MKKKALILLFCVCQVICRAQDCLSVFEERVFCGFTEDGTIFTSFDGGAGWCRTDFNSKYAGYYPHVEFVATAAGAGEVAVAGLDEEGHPHLYLSTGGSVWSERELSWLEEDGSPARLEAVPESLAYDPAMDSFLLNCTDSTTLVLPPCSHCNRLVRNGGNPAG